MKQSLQSLLEAFGGETNLDFISLSAKKELDAYTLLSGVDPVLVPAPGGAQTTPPSRFAKIRFVDQIGVNAVTALAEEEPALLVYSGTPFALNDYFNKLLSYQAILKSFDSKAERGKLDEDSIRLDHDYRGFVRGKYPDNRPLTQADVPEGWSLAPGAVIVQSWTSYLALTPQSPYRSEIVSYLYFTVLSFLLEHEKAHVDNGHLEFAESTFGVTSIAEFGADQLRGDKAAVPGDVLQTLEMDADINGVMQSLKSCLYPPEFLRHSIWGKLVFSLDRVSTIRLWLFAIGALFCLFEFSSPRRFERWSWLTRRQQDHPSGLIRFAAAATHASLMVPEELKPQFTEAWRLVLDDIQSVMVLLGMRQKWDRFWKTDSGPELNRLSSQLRRLRPELDICSRRIQGHYFVSGTKVPPK